MKKISKVLEVYMVFCENVFFKTFFENFLRQWSTNKGQNQEKYNKMPNRDMKYDSDTKMSQ